MAAGAPMSYCGRCGAPLAPGARFCGRCGTPVLQAAVATPVYRYAPAPHVAYPTAARAKLAPALIAGGLIAILLVVAVVVGGIAVSQIGRGGHAACTSNCPPKVVTPLAEQASYKSPTYKFEVNYSSRWTVRDKSDVGVTLGTRLGLVQVTGSAAPSAEQAMQAALNALPSSTWQDVTLLNGLKGAHLGEVQGVGAVYSANLVGTSQTAAKVRIAVIAAIKNGVTVVVLAADPADPKGSPNGFPEAQLVDYLCTEFVWGS
jgi:zinc ribbon protein